MLICFCADHMHTILLLSLSGSMRPQAGKQHFHINIIWRERRAARAGGERLLFSSSIFLLSARYCLKYLFEARSYTIVVCVKNVQKYLGSFQIFFCPGNGTDSFPPTGKNPLGTFRPRVSGQTRNIWGFFPGQYLADNITSEPQLQFQWKKCKM